MRASLTLATALLWAVPTVSLNASAFAQTTWHVDDDAPNDPAPGDPSVSDPAEDGSAEHPFDAIQEGIDAAADSDTVLLADGLYTGDGNQHMSYEEKSITVRSVNGPDVTTVDGLESAMFAFRFWRSQPAEQVLEGLTIRNFVEGAIYCSRKEPTIRDCIFTQNVNYAGGAIQISRGSPTLENCVFMDNEATGFGGAVYNYISGQPTFVDCIFIANSSRRGGAIEVFDSADPTLTRCSFLYNSAAAEGGAVRCNQFGTLSDCTFHGNSAHEGGALSLDIMYDLALAVSDCTFAENTAAESGGAIYRSGSGTVTIAECSFNGNTAMGDYYYGGGGGVWCADSNLAISGCVFQGNQSAASGGGVYCENMQHELALLDCTFSDNVAALSGGGAWAWADVLTVTNCSFSDNQAGESGGGARLLGATVTGCTFLGNHATRGGGLTGGSSLTECRFETNTAQDEGGGMYIFYDSSPWLTECDFYQNSADLGGGMYNNSDSEARLINCRLIANSAHTQGGGIYNNTRASPDLTNCVLGGNAALGSGGAMYNLAYAVPKLANCTLSGNTADANGGGIYNVADSSVILENSILWANSDTTGNGESAQIYLEDDAGAIVNYSCVQGWTDALGGTGNIGSDPLFSGQDDLHLSPGSPCIDAGDNTAVPPDLADLDGDGDTDEPTPYDLDGYPRFFDDVLAPDTGNGTPPIVDMGVYEAQAAQGFLLTPKTVTVPEGSTGTFTVAMVLDPLGPIEVTVAWHTGDPDISVVDGQTLFFDSSNYSLPQTVTLAAADDEDYLHGEAEIWVTAPDIPTGKVKATEADDDPAPAVLLVDDDAPPGGDGSGWPEALNTLQDALSIASGHPEVVGIHLAQGTYRPDERSDWPEEGTGDRRATFQLLNSLAILGGYAGLGQTDPDLRDIAAYPTILSGDIGTEGDHTDNCYHVVTGSYTDDSAVLDGVTITAGNASGGEANARGGGMYTLQGTPTLNECTFSSNSADETGGGMYNESSSPCLADCYFRENSAGHRGAGMANYNNSSPQLTDCTFSANSSAGAGGGIHNYYHCSPTLTGCTFNENSSGGLVHNSWGTLTLINCTFRHNSARSGAGGMTSNGGSVYLTSCMFVDNTTEGYGGGLSISEQEVLLQQCMFVRNSAIGGGGAFNDLGGEATFTECVFTQNIAATSGGGLCNSGQATLTGCSFTNNRVTEPGTASGADGGGGMSTRGGSLADCSFYRNISHRAGGLAIFGDTTVTNCRFTQNQANANGGGVLCEVGSAAFTNCLFYGNSVGARGGGVANLDPWNQGPARTFNHCTFARNSAGLAGGGFSHADNNDSPSLANCVLWLNKDAGGMDESAQVFFAGQMPVLEYCCVQGWSGALGGVGNIGDYPQFVAGYYLSQTAAGQATDSPCVDAGDPTSPLIDGTTRTDGLQDEGVVDMGYHYRGPACFGDVNGDGYRDLTDFCIWARAYPSAVGDPQFDPAADLNGDGFVNVGDFTIFLAEYRQPCP